MKDERVRASKVLKGPTAKYTGDKKAFIEADARRPLRLEDLQLRPGLRANAGRGQQEYKWHLDFGDDRPALARRLHHPRRASCDRIKEAFDTDPNLENLLLAPYFTQAVKKAQANWRQVVALGAAARHRRCPRSPRRSAYYDGYRAAASAGQPAAGPARLLRRPHLRAHRISRAASSSTPTGAGFGGYQGPHAYA